MLPDPQKKRKNFLKNRALGLLTNLIPGKDWLKPTVWEGIVALKPYAKDLEAVHIEADFPAPSAWRKKDYYHIVRHDIGTRLDEWIFENLVDQSRYAGYLDRYRPALRKGRIANKDEYILDRHYRPRALKSLSGRKGFNLREWTRKRTELEYRRRTVVPLYFGSNFDVGKNLYREIRKRGLPVEKAFSLSGDPIQIFNIISR